VDGVRGSDYAVAAFIVISGYCLALPVVRDGGELKGGAFRFYRRRARRILPPYYAAVGLSLLATLFITAGSYWSGLKPDRDGYLGHLLMVQDVVGRGQVNTPLWSIAVEWRIYFLLPLLVLALKHLRTPTVVIGTVALSYFLLLPAVALGLIDANVQFLALFVLGMFAARITHSPEAQQRYLRLPWRTLACGFAAAVIALQHWWGAEQFIDVFLGLFMVCVLAGASSPSRLSRTLGWRPLSFIGAYSDSLYLMHVPIIALEWQWLIHPLGLTGGTALLMLIAVGAPIVLALTFVFFLVFERPFMSGAQRRAARGEFAFVPA